MRKTEKVVNESLLGTYKYILVRIQATLSFSFTFISKFEFEIVSEKTEVKPINVAGSVWSLQVIKIIWEKLLQISSLKRPDNQSYIIAIPIIRNRRQFRVTENATFDRFWW